MFCVKHFLWYMALIMNAPLQLTNNLTLTIIENRTFSIIVKIFAFHNLQQKKKKKKTNFF